MEIMYPTEVITVPSQGKYYPSGHPLKENGGKLTIKHMTAKEEDILTSSNLIANGQVIDKFLESIIVHKGVDYKDLSTGDIMAVMIAARVLGYGKDYPATLSCNHCGKEFDHIVDLSQLEAPDEIFEPNPDGTNTFELPALGKPITIRYLSRRDEIEADKQNKTLMDRGLSTNSTLVTSRLKRIVVAIDGVTDKDFIARSVENLVIADTRKINEEFEKLNPTIDQTIEVECPHCNNIIRGAVPISADFFWPNL